MLKQTRKSGIKSFLAFSLPFYSQFLFAQTTGRIQGRVFDKDLPLKFVPVSIFKQVETARVVYAVTTDGSGAFFIDRIELDDYLVKFSLIGYQPSAKKFSITSAAGLLKFEKYQVKKDVNFLKKVTVTSQKKLIEKPQQGLIVNAAANITAIGGTATNILKTALTISADAQGAIIL